MERPRSVVAALAIQAVAAALFGGAGLGVAYFGRTVIVIPFLGWIAGTLLLILAGVLVLLACFAAMSCVATYRGSSGGYGVALASHALLALGLLVLLGWLSGLELGGWRVLLWASVVAVGTSGGLLLSEDARAWFHRSA